MQGACCCWVVFIWGCLAQTYLNNNIFDYIILSVTLTWWIIKSFTIILSFHSLHIFSPLHLLEHWLYKPHCVLFFICLAVSSFKCFFSELPLWLLRVFNFLSGLLSLCSLGFVISVGGSSLECFIDSLNKSIKYDVNFLLVVDGTEYLLVIWRLIFILHQ